MLDKKSFDVNSLVGLEARQYQTFLKGSPVPLEKVDRGDLEPVEPGGCLVFLEDALVAMLDCWTLTPGWPRLESVPAWISTLRLALASDGWLKMTDAKPLADLLIELRPKYKQALPVAPRVYRGQLDGLRRLDRFDTAIGKVDIPAGGELQFAGANWAHTCGGWWEPYCHADFLWVEHGVCLLYVWTSNSECAQVDLFPFRLAPAAEEKTMDDAGGGGSPP